MGRAKINNAILSGNGEAYATKEEAFKNTRPAPGKDFRLIVRQLGPDW